jgi:hypothetical protein
MWLWTGDCILVSLTEYAKLHGKSPDTLRRMAEKGEFVIAENDKTKGVSASDAYKINNRKRRSAVIRIPYSKKARKELGIILWRKKQWVNQQMEMKI